MHNPVIIVGAGIAGLACGRYLHTRRVNVIVLEQSERVGGRIKTDAVEGYLLDRGFQVLQTAYPEARRVLDYRALDLNAFAPGVIVRIAGRFYTVADPLRLPGELLGTLTAPIGGLADRLRLLHLVRQVTRGRLENIFDQPESTAVDFLRASGFSETMIRRFFIPFFGGVCLDPHIRASSRVLRYVMRMFATGRAALPADGMEQIPRQLAADLPSECLRTGVRARRVNADGVILDDGTAMPARAVVVATEAPSARRLLGLPPTGESVAETCLYFSCDRENWHPSFLILSGDGSGPINNIVFPSRVCPNYAPAGKTLVGVVVLGIPDDSDTGLIDRVRGQLVDWFGPQVHRWRHLRTYPIAHALPGQSPPTADPTRPQNRLSPGIFVCGEYGSLPGIQWALFSGRLAAKAILAASTK